MLPKFSFLLYYNIYCNYGEISNLQSTVFNIVHFEPSTEALHGLFL